MVNKSHIPGYGEIHEFVRDYPHNPKAQHDPQAARIYRELLDNASVCSYCGVGCPYTVYEAKPGARKIHPLSPLGLCVKGETSLYTGSEAERPKRLRRRKLADDRIRAPMIRDHDGAMKEVSWDEALDRAAWLFLHTREWVGPQTAAIYGNGQKTMEAIWMACLYKLVFKLPTVGANSEHCLASAGSAHEQNFGNEASFTWREFDELAHCDVAVMHGTNPYVTFPQAYEKIKANRHAVKVVIDPIRSDTVSDLEADDPRTLHIRFEQGGDILFNMAVARLILENAWEDSDYLEKAVERESFEAFRNLCMEDRFRLEAVAERVVLEEDDPRDLAEKIRRYANLIARPDATGERPRPAFVSSMGINQSTGTYGFSSNLNLLLLTGNVGRRGAGSMRIAGQSNATSELSLGFNSRRLLFNLDPENPDHRRKLAQALDLPEHNIPDHKGTPVAHMADDDYLYCFFFIGTQMTRNMPRLGHWTRRMGRAFNIVIDPFLAEGVLDYADVLLPSLTYTERTGVIQRGDRSLQLQQRVSEPPPLAWSDEQILARLALAIAKRLRNPATAALNDLDPEVVARTFGRYVDAQGQVNPAKVFDHIVTTSQQLDLYNRLETEDDQAITHDLLKRNAGRGIQWQGDGRYAQAREDGAVFPEVNHGNRQRARLVKPPEALLQQLVAPNRDRLKSLISGRGRPGFRGKFYRGRYNSGIKTLPITGAAKDEYRIEVNPEYARQNGFQENDRVRIASHHGTVFAQISLNERVPGGFPFIDFVPGEINRLTDYLDQDHFTNQSLIKRTPVRIEAMTRTETILWESPAAAVLQTVIANIYDHFRCAYPEDGDWEAFARSEDGATDWLPLDHLYNPQTPEQRGIADQVGAMAVFLQRYDGDRSYRKTAGEALHDFDEPTRQRFMHILLPLLRKLDYHSSLLDLLGDMVGSIRVKNADGSLETITLKAAHQAAILELKEEVVAAQLFVAIKRGLEILYGVNAMVPRENLAFVSGIAIPCSGDVPAFVMGIPPSALDTRRLIHSRAIGIHALLIVDTVERRAVKMDIQTGVLPKDKELRHLRSQVIVKKRAATRYDHRRFFDRLGELIVKFVREGDANYHIIGPLKSVPWEEYQAKLAFVPALRKDFQEYLQTIALSPELIRFLMDIEILDAKRDAALLEILHTKKPQPPTQKPALPIMGQRQTTLAPIELPSMAGLSTRQKIERVIDAYIRPTLENDGGRIELMDFDETTGVLNIRFVGSCANCPYSMLTLENLVKPTLLSVSGVERVEHRGFIREGEEKRIQEKIAVSGSGATLRPTPAIAGIPIVCEDARPSA